MKNFKRLKPILLMVLMFCLYGKAGAQCALSGNYTVNSTMPTNVLTSGTNFNNFFDLAFALSQCGVNGHFTATVVPGTGPYHEQVRFFEIPGTGPNATVTIDGNNETITFLTDATNRHIFRLYNQQYFTLKNFKIERDPTAASGFMGVHIFTSGSNINIENIEVDMKGSTSTLVGGIIASGDTASILNGGNFQNISISNNKTIDGGYGVSVYGLSLSTLSNGISITNNHLIQASGNGIYLRETNAVQVKGNTINIRTGNGIQLAQSTNQNALIEGNWISADNLSITTTIRGIYVFGGIAGSTHKVINNVVHNMNTPLATVYAYAVRGSLSYFYNNTALLDGGSASASTVTAAFQEELSNTNFHLLNNIFVVNRLNTGNQAAIILGTTTNLTASFNSDKNVFYVPNGNIGSRGTTNYASLASWNSATTKDANSFNVDPLFMSAALPAPTNSLFDNQALPLTDVVTDILGNPRSPTPDPGAFEFPLATADVGVSMIEFFETCGKVEQPIMVEVFNHGTTSLSNFQVVAELNGIVNTSLSTIFTGTLAPYTAFVVNMGNVNTTAGGILDIKAFTSLANDINNLNDTLSLSINLFAAPIVNAGPDVNLCEGGNTILTATPAGLNFIWSTNETTTSISVSPTASTSYFVTGFDSNGCDASDTVNVNILPIPGLSFSGNLVICQGNSTTITASAPSATIFTWATGATTPEISVAPSTSTYYVLNVSNGTCSTTDSVLVTVNPAPQITGQTTYSICAGESLTISVSGADEYTWGHGPTSNIITVSPNSTTQYTVMGIYTATGCEAHYAIDVNVNLPTPIELTMLENVYCEDEWAIKLSASPAGGIFSGPGVTSDTLFLEPAIALAGYDSPFYVYYTFQNTSGCISTDSTSTSITICSSVNEMAGSKMLNVYPNPFSNSVYINLEKSKIDLLEMFDMKGAKVSVELIETGSNCQVVPHGKLEPGVYLIRVKYENSLRSVRLLKH